MPRLAVFLLFLVVLLKAALSTAALPALDSQGKPLPTLAPMLEEVTPAVVNISTFTRPSATNPLLRDPFFRRFFNLPPQRRQQPHAQSAGSGVIIDADKGLVVTNHHVIEGADAVKVGLTDGRELEAELLGSDPEVDIALLQVAADNLGELPLAASGTLRVGDFVVAIGNPFGLGQTVTTGVVSALGRTGLGIEGYESFIQTDASINPGNSGGALINLRGELVGINTAILAPSGGNVGIGFAIPVDMAASVVAQLEEFGRVRRGRLGISLQDLSAELADAFDLAPGAGGVLITQVVPGSAAQQAGLRVGDVILEVNGRPVFKSDALRSQIGVMAAGSELEIKLLRDGRRLQRRAVLAPLSDHREPGERYAPQLEGAWLGLDEDASGLSIVELEPGSPAAALGLRPEDRILAVNRQRVRSLEELARAVKRGGATLLLMIERKGSQLYLALPRP